MATVPIPQRKPQPTNFPSVVDTSLIKKFENPDNKGRGDDGLWKPFVVSDTETDIGFGHKLTSEEQKTGLIDIGGEFHNFKEGLSDSAIEALLQQDTATARNFVKSSFSDLNRNQSAAVTSLVFNTGIGGFKKSKAFAALQAGDFSTFRTEAFSADKGFVKANGKTLGGLVKRREQERHLFDRAAATTTAGELLPGAKKPFSNEATRAARREINEGLEEDIDKFPLARVGGESPVFAFGFNQGVPGTSVTKGFFKEGDFRATKTAGGPAGDALRAGRLLDSQAEDVIVLLEMGTPSGERIRGATGLEVMETYLHEARHAGIAKLEKINGGSLKLTKDIEKFNQLKIDRGIKDNLNNEEIVQLLGIVTGTETTDTSMIFNKYGADGLKELLQDEKILRALMAIQKAASDVIREQGGTTPIHFPSDKELAKGKGRFTRAFIKDE